MLTASSTRGVILFSRQPGKKNLASQDGTHGPMWCDNIYPIKAPGLVIGQYGLISSLDFLLSFCDISSSDVPFKGFWWH